MPARARSIVLTGAPAPSTLDWNSSELHQDPVPFITIALKDPSTCETPVRWRSLAPLPNPNPVGEADEGPALLFDGGKIDRYSGLIVDGDNGALGEEFYEHSFALHEGLGLVTQSEGDASLDMSLGDASLNDITTTTTTSIYPSSNETSAPAAPPHAPTTTTTAVGHLSDLEDIPDAQYLRSISPHTVTVNLIVAILHVSPRRRIRTKWGRETDIVEVLVADETRSGFRVTCWLPASNDEDGAQRTPTQFEIALAGLRPRDIVLFRGVALTSFRQQVYGQTLRYDMTKVDLLSRRPLDSGDPQGVFKWKVVVDTTETSDRQLRKVRRVRKWVMDFVGLAAAAGAAVDADSSEVMALSGEGEAVRNLPPDTQ